MAPACVVCGRDASVSDACPHCGAAVCADHRPAAAHDCPGTGAGTTGGWRVDLDGAGTDRPPARPLSSLLRPGLALAVLTVIVVVAAIGAVAYVGPVGDDLDPRGVERHIAERTTEERRAAGVGALRRDPDLAAVARAHSRDMRDRGFVNHTNPDGEGPTDRAAAAGIDCAVGENIYGMPRGGLATSERALADHVVRAWLESPGHRKTLLRDRYTRQGAGVAVGDEAVYVTVMYC